MDTLFGTTANRSQPASAAFEVTVQNFMGEVIHASLSRPVLVFFYSSASPSCAQFGALLEKLVAGTQGRVALGRVNIDKEAQIAQQFRIQGVPTVYIFSQGQPVDGFTGAVPEEQLKKMLAPILGANPAETDRKALLAEAAGLLEAGDVQAATEHYSLLHAGDPADPEAAAGLARALIAQKKLDDAENVLSSLPASAASHAQIAGARTLLSLARNAGSGNIAQLRAKLEKDTRDHGTRLALADALFAGGQQDEAIAELLTLFSLDRAWNDEAARKKLLTYFEALGPTHPLTMSGRRRLSSLLFS